MTVNVVSLNGPEIIFLLHHYLSMSLVVVSRLILPEDVLVLLLGLGDPG